MVLYLCHSSPAMKRSACVTPFLLISLSIPTLKAELLIPGGDDDGPHANKVMVFDGSLNFWANDLYGFKDGREVVFEDAGAVTIGDMVAPASVRVTGNGDTVWNGMGQIIGETSLVKEGSGTLKLNASNAYTGGTQIKEGTVQAGGSESFGSGLIDVSGGVLDLAGHEITNEIRLNGGQIQGATALGNQLIFKQNYSISQDIAARGIRMDEGLQLSVAAGATLSAEEELELKKARALDLSAGGQFCGNLMVERDGVLKLSTEGSTAILSGSVWHLNGATVSGNLTTAQNITAAMRSATAGSTLRISGSSRIHGALTLTGGTLLFSDAQASLHADTLVLSKPTVLQMHEAPVTGSSQPLLTYDRLLSGTVTDYYDFFGINQDEYELTVSAQGISISTAEPAPQPESPPVIEPTPQEPTPPIDTPEDTPDTTEPEPAPEDTPTDEGGLPDAPSDPGPIIPGAEGNDDSSQNQDNNTTQDEDDPHGPVIDTSGNDEDDPHNNKEEDTATTPSDSTADVDALLSPESGTALSQAAMQSAWSARFATHAFMSAVYDNSRNATSATWAAFYGGVSKTDDAGTVPGGDSSAYGIAIGAEAHPTDRTQVGLAVGGATGSVSGDSFGELDQLSLHAVIYAEHAFLKQDSRYNLNLYGAFGLSRTETDPGIYSGLENWHHNGLSVHTRLSWSMKLKESVIWSIYGGAEYYNGSDLSVDDERIRGITSLSGSIGSGMAWVTKQATLYAEAEFTGDMLQDSPTATVGGNEYRTAAPARSGFLLRCGIQLRPESSPRSINLNYTCESRRNSSAHVLSAGITQVF